MKLSIITICYNIKNEIERTCQSIASQTNPNFEWIVIDGSSTDGTVDILNKYKDKITIFISEPDKGIYDAMNKGIKHASGEFLNFMNGGDEFFKDTIVDEFLKYDTNGIDVLYGNTNVIEDNSPAHILIYPDSIDKFFFIHNCIGHQASFIRRELFEKYGLYSEQYRIVSDWEKWLIFTINNCTFKHWNNTVSRFYNKGISSKLDKTHVKERTTVLKTYYTLKEIKECKKLSFNWTYITLFNFLPLLRIKETKTGTRTIFSLFSVIPLYRIDKKHGPIKHYLFGFLPIIQIKERLL